MMAKEIQVWNKCATCGIPQSKNFGGEDFSGALGYYLEKVYCPEHTPVIEYDGYYED